MSYSLQGRNVLITGGSRGLGAVIAQKFASEGSNIAINYVSSKDAAEQLASELQSKFGVKTTTIQGDAGLLEDCKKAVKTTIDELGGLDIIISNAVRISTATISFASELADHCCQGWTKVTNFGDLHAMNDDEWDKCWSTNVKGNMYLLREALPTFNANPEGGAFLLTSSVAGVTATGSSMPYAVTKAAGLHLMKCLAQTQGDKVRVNAVLPGLLLTDWGNRFPPEKIEAYKDKTVLRRLPELEDTANLYVMLARNASVTGQSIQIDGGFAVI